MATLGKNDEGAASLVKATLGKHLERGNKKGGEGEKAREAKKRRGRRKEEKGEGGKQVKRRADNMPRLATRRAQRRKEKTHKNANTGGERA